MGSGGFKKERPMEVKMTTWNQYVDEHTGVPRADRKTWVGDSERLKSKIQHVRQYALTAYVAMMNPSLKYPHEQPTQARAFDALHADFEKALFSITKLEDEQRESWL
jgi:hypothetical protein